MEAIEFKLQGKQVQLFIDGQQEGFLELSSLGGAYQIEDVEINKEFQGKGFYKQLLIAGIQMKNADMLISNNRNSNSNPIYAIWTKNEELEKNQQVDIYIDGEELVFNISE